MISRWCVFQAKWQDFVPIKSTRSSERCNFFCSFTKRNLPITSNLVTYRALPTLSIQSSILVKGYVSVLVALFNLQKLVQTRKDLSGFGTKIHSDDQVLSQ